MGQFSAQVDKIVLVNKKRLNAYQRLFFQELVNEAQIPVAKGGKMHLDTGFLRASGQYSLTGVPSGPTRPEAKVKYSYAPGTAILALNGATLGNPLYFGWSADYAAVRELYDGFRAGALQKAQEISDKVVAKIKDKVKT